MSWLVVTIAFAVGAVFGSVLTRLLSSPNRESESTTRAISTETTSGLLPFSQSSSEPRASEAPARRARRTKGSSSNMPEGDFRSDVLEDVFAYFEEQGIDDVECEFSPNTRPHLACYRARWGGHVAFDGRDRSVSITLTVYGNTPDEVWLTLSVGHERALEGSPWIRLTQHLGEERDWTIQRMDDPLDPSLIDLLGSKSIERMAEVVGAFHAPSSDTTMWSFGINSSSIDANVRLSDSEADILAFLGELLGEFGAHRFNSPTWMELFERLHDTDLEPTLLREIAISLIAKASSDARREEAIELALTHPEPDVRLEAVVVTLAHVPTPENVARLRVVLTELAEGQTTDALANSTVERILDVLECLERDDEVAFCGALVGVLTYNSNHRARAILLADPLLDEGSPWREEPAVSTFAERMLSEIDPREDYERLLAWMRFGKSPFYSTQTAQRLWAMAAPPSDYVLESALGAALEACDDSEYYMHTLLKPMVEDERAASRRHMVQRAFGVARLDGLLTNQAQLRKDDELLYCLRGMALFGGAGSFAWLKKNASSRSYREFSEPMADALAEIEARAVSGGLSEVTAGPMGGLTDASSAGGLSDA